MKAINNAIVYPVIAYRYGNKNNHSYLVGICSKKQAAIKAADNEKEQRGSKYECSVYETRVVNKWNQSNLPNKGKEVYTNITPLTLL